MPPVFSNEEIKIKVTQLVTGRAKVGILVFWIEKH